MHPCNPSPTYYLLLTTHNLLLGGHVLLVASSAAAAPGVPGVAAYAASKAYVRRRAGYPPLSPNSIPLHTAAAATNSLLRLLLAMLYTSPSYLPPGVLYTCAASHTNILTC